MPTKHDKNARSLTQLHVGQNVLFQHPEKRGWCKAVVKWLPPRSYIVETDNGVTYRRNRIHVRVDNAQSHLTYMPILPPLNDSNAVSENVRSDSNPPYDRPRRNTRPPSWLQGLREGGGKGGTMTSGPLVCRGPMSSRGGPSKLH